MTESMRDRMAHLVNELLDQDPRVALILADISAGYFSEAMKNYPNRALNVGIMEQTAVSLAAGLALEGFHPIVHSIAPFVVERPFEQIKDDFCYQKLGGTFVSIGASYDYGTDGMTHHGPGDVAILKTLPRMQVAVPGSANEFELLLRQTYDNGMPTYLRTSIQQNETTLPVEFGKLYRVQEGSQGVVIAVGPMLTRTLAAVAGMDLTVLYATTVVPFDAQTLQAAVAQTEANIILVEPYYEGTLIKEVATALRHRPVRIEAIGVPKKVLHRYGPPEQHDEALGLTPTGIRRRIEAFLAMDASSFEA